MNEWQRNRMEDMQQNCYDKDGVWQKTGLRHTAPAKPYKLEELFETHKEIFLKDMSTTRIHFGHYLIVKIAGAPVKQRGLVVGVQDRTGQTAQVRLYNYLSPTMSHGTPVNWVFFPENTLVIVEPWVGCTHRGPNPNGGALNIEIQVLNPGHFTLLHCKHFLLKKLTWDESRYRNYQFDLLKNTKLESDFKTQGNELFKKGKFNEAAEAYTLCLIIDIDLTDEVGLVLPRVAIVLSNRSECFLQMKLYHFALRDAQSSLYINRYNVKSICRMARAQIGLLQYDQAVVQVHKGLMMAPENLSLLSIKESLTRRSETPHHVREVDFKGMLEDSSRQSNRGEARLMWPDFLGPVEIKASKQCKGRGMFASRNLGIGEVVLVEKALTAVFATEIDKAKVELDPTYQHGQVVLCSRLMTEIAWRLTVLGTWTPSFTATIERLYAGTPEAENDKVAMKAAGKEPLPQPNRIVHSKIWDDVAEKYGVDFDHIQALMCSYTASCATLHIEKEFLSDEDAADLVRYGMVVCNQFNMINHSCVPNCRYSMIGDMIMVSTLGPIKAGTELTITYHARGRETPNMKEDVEGIMMNGFLCTCMPCEIGELTTQETLDMEKRLSDLKKTVKASGFVDPARLYHEMCEMCMEIEKLYIRPGDLVFQAYVIKNNLEKILQRPEEALVSYLRGAEAFTADLTGQEAADRWTVQKLLRLVADCKAQGKDKLAREWRILALRLARAQLGNCDVLVSFLYDLDI